MQLQLSRNEQDSFFLFPDGKTGIDSKVPRTNDLIPWHTSAHQPRWKGRRRTLKEFSDEKKEKGRERKGEKGRQAERQINGHKEKRKTVRPRE